MGHGIGMAVWEEVDEYGLARSDAQKIPLGWVTIERHGKRLVTRHGRLTADKKQRHITHWKRMMINDKSWAMVHVSSPRFRPELSEAGSRPGSPHSQGSPTGSSRRNSPTRGEMSSSRHDSPVDRGRSPHSEAHSSRVEPAWRAWRAIQVADGRELAAKVGNLESDALRPNIFAQELEADPDGIGFGLGSLHPGRTQPEAEWHRISFAVGSAGRYLLHIGLRSNGDALPGSPFKLEVSAGERMRQRRHYRHSCCRFER